MPIIQQSDFEGDPRIAILPVCQSTNRLMIDLLQQKKPMPLLAQQGWGWPGNPTAPQHGFVLGTNHQTHGRGQRGQHWEAQPGQNITCSLLWDPQLLPPSSHLWQWQVAVLLALVETLEAAGISDLKIKWPNDVYFQNKKIAGLLIESATRGTHVRYCVAGIGLNVNQTVFSTGQYASVAQALGHPVDLPELLWSLIDWTDRYFFGLQSGRAPAFNVLYHQKLMYLNQTVWLTNPSSQAAIEATLTGVNDLGHLLCKLPDEQTKAYAVGQVQISSL